ACGIKLMLEQAQVLGSLNGSSAPRWPRNSAMEPSGATPRTGAFLFQDEHLSEVTRILDVIEQGQTNGADQLLPLVYEELRRLAASKLARETPGQTLQATALVHEAYLRLVDTQSAQGWKSRGHFFAAAAEAMRRILIERARGKGRLKRGGD